MDRGCEGASGGSAADLVHAALALLPQRLLQPRHLLRPPDAASEHAGACPPRRLRSYRLCRLRIGSPPTPPRKHRGVLPHGPTDIRILILCA
jgi:hypothetical protein